MGSGRRRWLTGVVSGLAAVLLSLSAFSSAAHAPLFKVSESDEIKIGRQVEAEAAKTYGFVNEPARTRYVRQIGLRLARVSERPALPWCYHVVQDASVNAFAAPGGFIFVTKGLLSFVKSTDELAFVLGHETTHIAHRHAVDLAQKQIELQFGAVLITQLVFGGSLSGYQLSSIATGLLGAKYSRDKEYEADHYGVLYAKRAGFDPRAAIAFFTRLRGLEQKQGAISTAFASHPPTPDRIKAVRDELRPLGYRVAVRRPSVSRPTPAAGAPETAAPSPDG